MWRMCGVRLHNRETQGAHPIGNWSEPNNWIRYCVVYPSPPTTVRTYEAPPRFPPPGTSAASPRQPVSAGARDFPAEPL